MALTELDSGTTTLDHTSLGIDQTLYTTVGLGAFVIVAFAPCSGAQAAQFKLCDPNMYPYDVVPLWTWDATYADAATQQFASPPIPLPSGGTVLVSQQAGAADVVVYWRIYGL